MASQVSRSETEGEQEPLSSRSSYYSALETDTSNMNDEQLVTTNGEDCRTSEQPTNGTANSNNITSTPSPKKSHRNSTSASPSVKHLANHQKRAVGSFMETPSKSNWDELVRSMKKSAQKSADEESSTSKNKVKIPHLPMQHVRNLSFEPTQVHSIKDKSPAANDFNLKKMSSLSESAEDFAIEHGIFLKAALQLLHEKDRPATSAEVPMSECRFDDIHDVIKIGSLKKASKRVKGVWNVKFVEIRRGVFSYYGDNAANSSKPMIRRISAPSLNDNSNAEYDSPSLPRKDIPLHASECTCRAVKLRSMMRTNPGSRRSVTGDNVTGAVFELKRDGRRHLLMANTKEERRHWIQAIHDAMIGASVTRGDNFLEYQVDDCEDDAKDNKLYHNGVRLPRNTPYTDVMGRYLDMRDAIQSAQSKEEYKKALSCLNSRQQMIVPVEWIKSQFDISIENAFVEHDISSCVDQLWKDLCRDSVDINGNVLMGDAYRGPDRILGTLTRQILHYGGASSDRITECQAVSYARDILLSSDRTRSGGDSYYCAEHLCLNRELVVICPTSVEAKPLSISVSPAGFGRGNPSDDMHDVVCGWASVRLPNKRWVRSFLILGRNMLSCYAKAEPIPHKLREKIPLKDAVIDDSLSHDLNSSLPQQEQSIFQFSIMVNNKRVRRDFLFDDEASYSFWRNAFDTAAQSAEENSFRESINNHEMEFLDTSTRVMDDSRDSRYSMVTPTLLSRNVLPAVDVEINVSAEYKLVTLDPQGEDCSDTWATLRTTFIQKFRLSGGSRGRISRGDEVVKLELL